MCVCIFAFVCLSVHLPLCADMGSFSPTTQCSFYLCSFLPLSLFLSSPLSSSLVTQLSATSNALQHLLSDMFALLGEAELPSSPSAQRIPLLLRHLLSLAAFHSLCCCHFLSLSSSSLCRPIYISLPYPSGVFFVFFLPLFLFYPCKSGSNMKAARSGWELDPKLEGYKRIFSPQPKSLIYGTLFLINTIYQALVIKKQL